MKVKLFDRILLALLLFIVLLFSILLIVLSVGLFPLADVQQVIHAIFTTQTYVIILGAVGLVLFLITLRLLFFGNGGGEKKEPMPSSTLIKAGELGASFITLSAIDAMVQKHCHANNRIRNTISSVNAVREGGVTISVRLSLMPDTDIPELTSGLQASLKEYIEKYAGINVREIGILVEDTSTNPKSRVD